MAADNDTSTASGVEVTLTEGEGLARTLMVTVPPARVSKTRSAEAGRLSKRLKLKGFRKGKVPASVVEQRFGAEIDDRVQQRLLDEAYREALDEVDLTPAGPGRIIDIKYQPGEPFVFQAELEVMPKVRLKRTGGFQVARQVPDVTDDEVAEIMERIREENADWAGVDRRPTPGDRVSVRISPLEAGSDEPAGEGTPYQLVLGEGKALEGVEAAIQTLAPGESGIFAIEFPAEDETEASAAAASEISEGDTITRRLHIALAEVEEKDLPPLDDRLAAEVGEFETVADLEAAVREDLRRHHEEEGEDRLRGELMEALREANPFVVPQALVDRYIQNMVQAPEETDPAEVDRMRQAIGPHAERQIRDQLLLDAVIEQEGLAATSEEVDERVAALAERHGVAPSKLRRDLVREDRLEALRRNLAVEKAFTYLKDQSGIA